MRWRADCNWINKDLIGPLGCNRPETHYGGSITTGHAGHTGPIKAFGKRCTHPEVVLKESHLLLLLLVFRDLQLPVKAMQREKKNLIRRRLFSPIAMEAFAKVSRTKS